MELYLQVKHLLWGIKRKLTIYYNTAMIVVFFILFVYLALLQTRSTTIIYPQSRLTRARILDDAASLFNPDKSANPFQLVPPFIEAAPQGYKVVPHLSLAVCQITKIMSTVIAGIFCYLYDTEAFLKANRTIATENYFNKFCTDKNEYHYYADMEVALGANFTKIAFYRDPMQRFLSGYVDKCVNEVRKGNTWICYDCKEDLKCVLENLYKDLLDCPRNDSFNSYDITHFAPQNWYCDFKTHFDEYHMFEYSNKRTAAIDFAEILQKKNVPIEKINHIKDTILETNAVHATSGSNTVNQTRDKLLNDPYLLSIFTSIYYYDYFLFRIELPMKLSNLESLKHLLKTKKDRKIAT